jgi:hypothetical protein
MLARPTAIAAVSVADRLASRTVHVGAAPRIVARSGLRCQRIASRFDRSQSVLAPRFWHARIAMAPPSLEDWLAAYRARNRIGWA